MKTLTEIADFIENHVIECEPNTGCGKCDEARECVKDLREIENKISFLLAVTNPLRIFFQKDD
jgi:positive regulator of sigma E activity